MTAPAQQGAFAHRIPPRPSVHRLVIDAVSEVNRTAGTETDEMMAVVLIRALERRGVMLATRKESQHG